MFTQRITMAWICVLMFIAITVSLAIGSEDDKMQSVRSMGSWNRRHWRGNGDSNQQKIDDIHILDDTTTLIPDLIRAIQTFSLSMYHRLKVNNPNFVFSPYSVHTALTMTSMGATQLTAEEMLRVLGLKELKEVHQVYEILTQSLQQPSNVTLDLANAVFLNPSYTVNNNFKTGLKRFYKAGFDVFQFKAPGGPEVPINQWVSDKTAGMIPGVLQSGTIDGLTVMIIVNAIYFKGIWRDPFNAKATKENYFYVTKDIKVKVPLMTKETMYKYTESNDLKASILELPYAEDRFSMFIILPKIRNDLDAVEKLVNSASLTNAFHYLRPEELQVFLPKFKVESEFKLKDTLMQMGMVKAFGDATFDNISSRRGLYISDVIHKAVIEVTEEGTKAAAVTSIRPNFLSARPQPTQFRADHPFIYFVRDNVNEIILFLGKYSGPN